MSPLLPRHSPLLAILPFLYLTGQVPPSVTPFTFQLVLGVLLGRLLGEGVKEGEQTWATSRCGSS